MHLVLAAVSDQQWGFCTFLCLLFAGRGRSGALQVNQGEAMLGSS
jgi:hypothetical protein